MMVLAFAYAAFATDIYVNGTKADVMPAVTMENVNVRFDAQGNCWIDAPMYKITVVQPGGSTATQMNGNSGYGASSSYSAPSPAYSAPSPAYSAPSPAYSAPTYTAPAAPAYVPPATSSYSTPTSSYSAAPSGYPAPVSGLPAGTWWLVTEDNDSSGQAIDVVVNGNPVRRVRSGEGQVIIDIGAFLQHGANKVVLTALPGSYGGGLLAVYLGKGSDAGGTVRMDAPDVRFARRATDSASGTTREFTLTAP